MTRPTHSELYQLFDHSPIGMYRSREDGSFVYVNPAMVRLLGYDSAEQLQATNLERDIYVDPAERARVIATYRPRGAIDGAQVQWKTRDGRRLIVRVFGHLVEGDGGVSFDASVLDVTALEAANTEQRRQRAELERTATTLDTVVRQVSAIWWVVDRDLRILRTGGSVQDILGYAPDTYIGQTLYDVINSDPTADDVALAAHLSALEGRVATYATEGYRAKQLESRVAPYRVDGEIIGAIGTTIDVTSSRALERRMVDAQRAESLGVLAGGLAHDFNNLLVAILGNADLGLRDTSPGAPGHSELANIRDASLRAAELTDQLLAYAGRGSVSAARVQPAPLVAELLRISAPRLPANVTVHVDIPGHLAVRGDAGQIRQVLLNLIGNAREAIGDRGGTIEITGRAVDHDGVADPDDILTAAPGPYVILEVNDDGAGMDRELRRRIFEPFFTTKPTGHGLGLAALLGIVRSHGGGLRLTTCPSSGAKFQVLWPSTTTPGAQPALPKLPTRTVLVIDDEDLVRDVVARMIEDLGYAALTAADGMTGLAMFEAQVVDAVLVDLTMPRMGGAEVVAALRARRPTLPIIVCTGFDRDGQGPTQADAYLPKPFRLEVLEHTLVRLLNGRLQDPDPLIR